MNRLPALKTHWEHLRRRLRTRATLGTSLALALLATLVLVGINEAGYQRSSAAVEHIAQTQVTRATLNLLLQRMLDAETGQRGYLLTGDERYLAPYTDAATDINGQLDTLRQLYVTDPGELAAFSQLSRHISRKLSEMDLSVRLRKQGNEDAWKFVMLTDVGKEQMDAIRDQTTALIQESTRRMEEGQQQISHSLLLSRGGIALMAALGLLAFYLYLRQSQALQRAGEREQAALARERDRLEGLVRERTASLAELATHLQQVREEERAHLARELHDELGALLTAAKLDVARIKSRLGGQAPEALQQLQHLNESLNSGIALKRRIIEDLRPSSLSNLGLVAALEILAREFSERSGLPVRTRLEDAQLDEPSQLTLYRLVQESFTNIGKYAQAHHVELTLEHLGDHVGVRVTDDGVGFDPAHLKTGSHGLAGMRHRVEAAGGRLQVKATPGGGTCIQASLPVPVAAG